MSKQELRCQKSSVWHSGYSENGSAKTSLFTNEVPVHWASHLHSFNYHSETGWEIPTVLVQTVYTQAKQMQQCNIVFPNYEQETNVSALNEVRAYLYYYLFISRLLKEVCIEFIARQFMHLCIYAWMVFCVNFQAKSLFTYKYFCCSQEQD